MLHNRIIIKTIAHLFNILDQDYFEPCDLPDYDDFEMIQSPSYPQYIKCLRNPEDHRTTEAYYVTPTGTYKLNTFLILLLDNNYTQFKEYSVTVRNHYHWQDSNIDTVETKLNSKHLNPLSLINLIANPYISHYEHKCKLGAFYTSSEYYQDTYLLNYHLNVVLDIYHHDGFTGNRSHLKHAIGDLFEKYENAYANLVHLTKGDLE